MFGSAKSDKAAIRMETKDKHISNKTSDRSYIHMVPAVDGTWYTLQIITDIETQTVNVFINGKMGVEGVAPILYKQREEPKAQEAVVEEKKSKPTKKLQVQQYMKLKMLKVKVR